MTRITDGMVGLHDPGRGSLFVRLEGQKTEHWRVLEGACETPFGSWTFRDRCVQSEEVTAWSNWLGGAADLASSNSADARTTPYPQQPLLEFGFVEPVFQFELLIAGGNWARLRIGFQWTTLPRGQDGNPLEFAKDRPISIDICVPSDQLLQLGAYLEGASSNRK